MRTIVAKGQTFIYGLFDPRNDECFYVGKSDNPSRRLKEHLECDKNFGKARRIKQIKGSGQIPDLKILEQVAYDQWESAEILWIKHFQEAGHPITNLTPGGIMPYAISPERAYQLLEEMPQKTDRLEYLLDWLATTPINPLFRDWRAAALQAIRTLTRILIVNADLAARLKAAIHMNRTLEWLEARYAKQN